MCVFLRERSRRQVLRAHRHRPSHSYSYLSRHRYGDGYNSRLPFTKSHLRLRLDSWS